MPIGGGQEERVLEGPIGTFAIAPDGLYFDRGFGDYAPPELYFHDLKSGQTRPLMRFERRKSAGLALAPSGDSLLVPLNDRQSSEIVLVGP